MPHRAIVYAEGAFNTPNGKTAHGLVRFTERYDVAAVIDSRFAGRDAGEVLDGRPVGIPIVKHLADALAHASKTAAATHFVVGLAPDGGRLPAAAPRTCARRSSGGCTLTVDSTISSRTIRPSPRSPGRRDSSSAISARRRLAMTMHFFSGKIEHVTSLKIALLGTDSAVGKRTTAWILVHAFRKAGWAAELVGTGQTAWMQGARYSIVLDSLINDFVAGEIEHAVWSAWREASPQAIVIEGQGSLMNPAYPGGFEILAAGRPDCVVLQHARKAQEYDGFPGYPIHGLPQQIEAIRILSGKPVVAITINHEEMDEAEIAASLETITKETGLPAFDVLKSGAAELVDLLQKLRTHD